MRFSTAIACAAILLGCAAAASAQAVSLKFEDGRVSLNAQDASIRTILAEWARVGGTKIVNHDRIGGGPVTLELTDVPERQALDVLLRTTAGYVVTARDGSSTGASRLGGVVILATSSAPRNQGPVTFGSPGTLPPPPMFESAQNRNEEQNQDNANRAVSIAPFPLTPGPATGPAVVRVGPGATTFGSPSTTTPAPNVPGQQGPSASPQILPGTSRPGEITPPPPQPQNPR
jgi:hypothetical protein